MPFVYGGCCPGVHSEVLCLLLSRVLGGRSMDLTAGQNPFLIAWNSVLWGPQACSLLTTHFDHWGAEPWLNQRPFQSSAEWTCSRNFCWVEEVMVSRQKLEDIFPFSFLLLQDVNKRCLFWGKMYNQHIPYQNIIFSIKQNLRGLMSFGKVSWLIFNEVSGVFFTKPILTYGAFYNQFIIIGGVHWVLPGVKKWIWYLTYQFEGLRGKAREDMKCS